MNPLENGQQGKSEAMSVKEDGAWQDLSLAEKFGDILKIGCQVDCKFIVGPKTDNNDESNQIFGHKWLFAVESPVFERMFCGDFMEAAKDNKAISLPDDDPETFRNLRRMLYNTRTLGFLNFDEIIKLYKLCDKYMVNSISKICVDHIRKKMFEKLSTTNLQLLTVYVVAKELQNKELLNDCKQRLQSMKYPLISELNILNVDQFKEYMGFYLSTNIGSQNHLEFFNAIESYLTQNDLIPQTLLQKQGESQSEASVEDFHTKEVKSDLLERLLSLVDFGKITLDNFLTGPGVSKILTWQQKYFILSQLAAVPCASCNYNIPITRTIKLFCENVAK